MQKKKIGGWVITGKQPLFHNSNNIFVTIHCNCFVNKNEHTIFHEQDCTLKKLETEISRTNVNYSISHGFISSGVYNFKRTFIENT